jgi:hypothetical protein
MPGHLWLPPYEGSNAGSTHTQERVDQRKRFDGSGLEGGVPDVVTGQKWNEEPAEPPAQGLQPEQVEAEEAEQMGTAGSCAFRQYDPGAGRTWSYAGGVIRKVCNALLSD